MPAYLIAEIEVVDSTGFEEYRQKVPATIAAHGGRYLARAGATETLEGNWSPKRLVVLEFPSMVQLKAWWTSPEYQPLRAIRQRTAKSKVVVTPRASEHASIWSATISGKRHRCLSCSPSVLKHALIASKR